MLRKGIVNQVKRNARSPGSGIITKVDTSEPAIWAGARLNHSKLNLMESSHWPDAVKTRGMQRAAWRPPNRGGREGLPHQRHPAGRMPRCCAPAKILPLAARGSTILVPNKAAWAVALTGTRSPRPPRLPWTSRFDDVHRHGVSFFGCFAAALLGVYGDW